MARTQRREQEPDAGTLSAPAEPAAEPAAPGGDKPANNGGAQVEVKAKGEAGAVRKALGRMAAEPAPEGRMTEGDIDAIAELLASPKHLVVVQRIYPRRWEGRRCDKKLDKFRCPITLDDLSDAVFEAYGGKRFNVDVHPNTPTGEFKEALVSFTIENPDTDEPYFPEDRPNLTGEDPTVVEDNDPMAMTEKLLEGKARMIGKRIEVREAKKALKELDDDDDKPPAAPAPPTGDPALDKRLHGIEEENRRLRDQLERKDRDDKLESRFRGLEDLIRDTSKGKQPPAQDNTLLVEVIRSGDVKFTSMMNAIVAANKPQAPAFDRKAMYEEMEQLKKVFGSDDNRVKRIEDRLFEFAMDHMGGGAAEEDTVKVAIKELTPVLRTYVERKVDADIQAAGQGGKRLTEEEIKKIQQEAAQKAAKELAEKWEREGVLVRVPQAGGKPAAPPPPPQPAPGTRTMVQVEPANLEGKPAAGAPQSAAPAAPVAPPAAQDNLPYEEVDGVKLPPSPQSPAYDRKRAVDFVLDTIIEDIGKGCPPDTFVVGDILDRLDDEILHDLLKISTGADLDALLRPWATPDKTAFIKKAGEEDTIKSWLTRIVVTAQDEYRRALAASEKRG